MSLPPLPQDILLKRSQVITHQEEKGSTFSKATFASAETDQDISIDDPDFWKKWAKKAQSSFSQVPSH